jgi:hypothetical protein
MIFARNITAKVLAKELEKNLLIHIKKGTNLVLLSPDVVKAFPTEEAINEALRSLINVTKKTTRKISE